MANSSTMRLTNAQQYEVSLVLEPWGEIYPMKSGETFEICFIEVTIEQAAHEPEIVWEKEQILVYAGAGGEITLFHDGVNLRES